MLAYIVKNGVGNNGAFANQTSKQVLKTKCATGIRAFKENSSKNLTCIKCINYYHICWNKITKLCWITAKMCESYQRESDK